MALKQSELIKLIGQYEAKLQLLGLFNDSLKLILQEQFSELKANFSNKLDSCLATITQLHDELNI